MFSVGGMVAALLVPIHIFLDGLAVPLGLLDASAGDFGRMQSLIANPFIKLYLFVLVVLPLYHAAHRIRFSLYELGFRKFSMLIDMLCYGGAVSATVVVLFVLLTIF